MQEIKTKKEQEEAKRLEKEKKKAEQATKKQQQQQQPCPQNPEEMFRTSEYSQWNDNGLPTHDKEGKELTKSQGKKVAKLMEAQRKKYEKWLQVQQQSWYYFYLYFPFKVYMSIPCFLFVLLLTIVNFL